MSLLVLSGCASPDVESDPSGRAVHGAELTAIEETVELTYRVSSFEDAASADPEEFRRPFTPTATLAYTRDGQLVEHSVDEYVEIRRNLLEAGEIRSLEEWEIVGDGEWKVHSLTWHAESPETPLPPRYRSPRAR